MQDNPQAQELARRAYDAMSAGRLDDAARLWLQVLSSAPNHPQALLQLGQFALRRGNRAEAVGYLDRAAAASPKDPIVQLTLAQARREMGDPNGEVKAYENALAADPYCYPAMLGKAELLDRMGKQRQAARFYRDALAIEPKTQISKELIARFDRARAAVAGNAERLQRYLDQRLQRVRESQGGGTERFEECVGIASGQMKAFVAQPTLLHYPALPAIQFFDRSAFPWLPELEAGTDAIRADLMRVLEGERDGFKPYVAYDPGIPVNQWSELNHSPKWSAFFLWEKGVRDEEHCKLCPNTAALMERLPLADVPGFAPTVMFSVLEPKTHIPPHTGVTNTRLVVHLPLIVPGPGKCFFRVGNEKREVETGKAWVFDDSIEHEAWNNADETRIILIVDTWNPLLSPAERALVCELLVGMRDYYREDLAAG